MSKDQHLHTVVETREFLSRAAGLFTDAERIALVDRLAETPQAGGARKLGARGRAVGRG